jgi:hypothetical protein
MSDVTTPGFEINFLLCRRIVWYISSNISEERSNFSFLNTETSVSETSVLLYQVTSRYLREGRLLWHNLLAIKGLSV